MAKHDQLVSQIRKMLNSYGAMNDTNLDQAGNTLPILKQVLKQGYNGYGDIWGSSTRSDRDAIGAAIAQLRDGVALGQDSAKKNTLTPNTASDNLLKSLIRERTKAGMSPEEARASVQQAVNQELRFTKTVGATDFKNSTLSQAEQQALAAKAAGSPTGHSASDNWGFDPSAAAQQQVLGSYIQKGSNDINQYRQVAGLMSGLVPAQLQPLYSLMVDQRAQEMQNNLDQYNSQMQAAPIVQVMKNAFQDAKAAGKASGSGGSSSPLDSLTGGSGTSGSILGGSASSSGLNGSDLLRQLNNTLGYGRQMGSAFSQFEKPVQSTDQLTYLRDFIPRSNAAANNVPSIMDYLAAAMSSNGGQG